MLTCFDVAEYFLGLVDEETDELLSNMKLQKLVYYAQGFHLALYNKPLFSDHPIKAWAHGPVVPVLYQKYKIHGAGGIPRPDSVDLSRYPNEAVELMDEVYEVYGQFSAWKLRNMTHEETPWAQTPQDSEISNLSMKSFFKTLLKDEDEPEA